MKLSLLILFFAASLTLQAQSGQVNHLPPGTYEVQHTSGTTFKGDIVLIDDSHYKLSTESTVGDYKFSATAQRVLFLSGTLKGAYARTVDTGTNATIVLPLKENAAAGFKLVQTDLQAAYKKG